MVKISLSFWDIAGQERFEFFKTDFFAGTAAVGLVFDLARPDTFEKVDAYFKEIRARAGNVPIILVGNKNDLKAEIGETVLREKIIQKVNQYNLFEYIETSALKNVNVDDLFNRLAITALLHLGSPRLGEIKNDHHFRFKVLLAGAAAVGKSSLIKTFVKKEFEKDYKITVGLDFMTQDFEIPDDELPKEVHEILKDAVAKFREVHYIPNKAEPASSKETVKETIKETIKETAKETVKEKITDKMEVNIPISEKKEKVFTHNYFYFSLIVIAIVIVSIVLVHAFFLL